MKKIMCFTLVLTLIMCLVGGGGVSMASNIETSIKDNVSDTIKVYNELSEQSEKISNNKVEELVSKTTELVKNKEVTLHSKNEINLDGASALLNKETNEIFLNVPMQTSDPLNNMEGIVLTFDQNNTLVNYSEIHLKTNKDELEGTSSYWVNGKLVSENHMNFSEKDFDKIVVFEKNDTNKMKLQAAPHKDFQKWFNGFNKCLSNKGVSWAMITLAGTICSGACVATAGAACLACFHGLTFLAGFNIGECFWKKY
ncbi:hypothetical protein [Bacillus paralicheniformis]|uniref:hypothetical protein n=1 Tax=Bacillus paralicheniformis TaxID=1648923 RepID=UPI00128B67F1|nr:hypothetical protein [Bacillus paralicheniformis]MPQ27491.1 hypothetical protein [Bacillus paralicheniformis]